MVAHTASVRRGTGVGWMIDVNMLRRHGERLRGIADKLWEELLEDLVVAVKGVRETGELALLSDSGLVGADGVLWAEHE